MGGWMGWDGWVGGWMDGCLSYLSEGFAEAPPLSATSSLSSLQLQPPLPGASKHHSCFAARSRANELCHSRLQTHIAGVPPSCGADNRGRFRAAPGIAFFWQLLRETKLSLQSGTHPNFFTLSNGNQALGTALCTLSTTFPDRGPQPKTYTEFTGKKNTRFHTPGFFTREFKRPWHDDVDVVGMTA